MGIKHVKYSLLIFFLLMHVISVGQTHRCGTHFSEADMAHLRNVVKRTPIDIAKDGDFECIPVRFHVVRESDGTTSSNPIDFVKVLANINSYSIDARVRYFLVEDPIYVDNSAHTILPNTTEDNIVNLFGTTLNAVQVYVVEELNPGVAGYAYYPNPAATSNRIFLRADYVNNQKGTTVAHELGHFFSLPHTFQGTENGPTDPEAENVARTGPNSNCDVGGDSFCDTEADPNDFIVGCDYTGTITDVNGEEYTPLTDNIMSYFTGPCREGYTLEQSTALRQGYFVRLGHDTYSLDAQPEDVAAPTDLIATVSGTNLDLTFTDNADNEYGYMLEYSTTGVDDFQGYLEAGILANQTSFSVTIDPALTYWFRVRPVKGGCDSYSNTVFISSGIDLDGNDSSGLSGNEYDAGSLCGAGSATITDNDVSIVGNLNQASIHVQITGALDGTNEKLLAPEEVGLNISGNGTASLIAINEGDLPVQTVANWISSIEYVHEGETIIEGTREIKFWVSSSGVSTEQSTAFIAVGNVYSAGNGGTLTACPEGTANWNELIPENASPNGFWEDGSGNTMSGTFSLEELDGSYQYSVGPDYCSDQATYSISEVDAPEYTLNTAQPFCETKCDGMISVDIHNEFTGFLDGIYFEGLTDELCSGEHDLFITNGTGCNRSRTIVLSYLFVPPLSFPNRICASDQIVPSEYFDGLPPFTDLSIEDQYFYPGYPLLLEPDSSYTISVFNSEACLNRSFNFETLMCPTPNSEVFFVPSAFSPDGDGLNDIFKPVTIFDLAYYELVIFDRMGGVAFESDNPAKGWNGADVQNAEYYAPPSLFNYRLTYQLTQDTDREVLKGNITLLR